MKSFFPYKAGRDAWNNRILEDARARRNWQLAAAVFAILALTSEGHVFYIQSQQKILTVATVLGPQDNLLTTYVSAPETITVPRESIIREDLKAFIEQVRGLSSDYVHKQKQYERANARLVGSAIKYVDDFFNQEPPHLLTKNFVINVTDIVALPDAGKVWRLEWAEEKLDKRSSQLVEKSSWKAIVTVELHPSDNLSIRTLNPFGVLISNISWEQVKGENS